MSTRRWQQSQVFVSLASARPMLPTPAWASWPLDVLSQLQVDAVAAVTDQYVAQADVCSSHSERLKRIAQEATDLEAVLEVSVQSMLDANGQVPIPPTSTLQVLTHPAVPPKLDFRAPPLQVLLNPGWALGYGLPASCVLRPILLKWCSATVICPPRLWYSRA